MSDDKGFRKMSELVEALRSAEVGLQNGSLSVSDLEGACSDARELYERLVVLRHKARESHKPKEPAQGTAAPPTVHAPTAPNDVRSTEHHEEPTPTAGVKDPAPQPAVIRLETRPPETRQTSLIEAIADTEKGTAPPAPAPKEPAAMQQKPVASLAEKMEKAHIDDLGKAISLSHKFWFTAELFNGDRTAFDGAVTHINSASDKEAATTFFRTQVLANLKKPADPEAEAAFTELIQRRFA